ncbi:hypothetical protein ACELLULO517_08085 [Acidisoma cellulosilytica]|uniref:Uncharacterized protein n=1 Tax=Acidisoma cellulosilyticum TaxID=2802395 RepID=A0A964E3E6_9PROT|nr:hypothetical protein [Acidisoma cellulosilyticum]MCB8880187.1 hypothetical protein [Acidisoma cellulosilyticum]
MLTYFQKHFQDEVIGGLFVAIILGILGLVWAVVWAKTGPWLSDRWALRSTRSRLKKVNQHHARLEDLRKQLTEPHYNNTRICGEFARAMLFGFYAMFFLIIAVMMFIVDIEQSISANLLDAGLLNSAALGLKIPKGLHGYVASTFDQLLLLFFFVGWLYHSAFLLRAFVNIAQSVNLPQSIKRLEARFDALVEQNRKQNPQR